MSSETKSADDTYKNLVDLLGEVLNIEYALMVQYLYAAFSIKPEYEAVRGQGAISEHYDLLGIAIEEMRHLHIASLLLSRLKSPPHIVPLSFPFKSYYYPFLMELKPLSAKTLAQYIYVEAQAKDVDLRKADKPEDRVFISRLYSELGSDVPPDLFDGLYGKIMALANQLVKNLPDGLKDMEQEFPLWLAKLKSVKENGLGDHYKFFRGLFMGQSKLIPKNIWDDASAANYPSFATSPPASIPGYEADLDSLDVTQKLVALGNLHLWIIIGLLNMTYRYDDWRDPDNDEPRRYLSLAQRHMRGPLLKIGVYLAAEKTLGLPFSAFPEKFSWDDEETAGSIIRKLVSRASEVAHSLDKTGDLINGFKLNIYQITLSNLSRT